MIQLSVSQINKKSNHGEVSSNQDRLSKKKSVLLKERQGKASSILRTGVDMEEAVDRVGIVSNHLGAMLKKKMKIPLMMG